jgi:hypothetical protein
MSSKPGPVQGRHSIFSPLILIWPCGPFLGVDRILAHSLFTLVYNYYNLIHTHYLSPPPSPKFSSADSRKEPYTDTLKIPYIEDSSPSPCSLFHVRGAFSSTVDSNQREGMGPLEYQAMPSFRVVAHDGVLCTFSNRSPPDQGKWCGPSGQAALDRPSRTKSHPCWVTLL